MIAVIPSGGVPNVLASPTARFYMWAGINGSANVGVVSKRQHDERERGRGGAAVGLRGAAVTGSVVAGLADEGVLFVA